MQKDLLTIVRTDLVLHEEHESRLNHTFAVVVQDLATPWIHSFFHAKPHQLRRRREASGTFLHPEENARSMFSDNSMEIFKHCEELNWKHERPTPRRSETNGIADRPVRRVKEGTSSVLVQSGLQESWWAETHGLLLLSSRCARPISADGQAPYERRFDSPFEGPIIPFGAEVKLYPISSTIPRSSASVRHKRPSWNIHGITP